MGMKIGIIGGGISGLYLANKLCDNLDNEVYIFEKSNYFGGRIYTNNLKDCIESCSEYYIKKDITEDQRKLLDTISYEAGPGRFSNTHENLYKLFDELGISSEDIFKLMNEFEYREEGYVESNKKYMNIVNMI